MSILEQVKQSILAPAGIQDSQIDQIMHQLLSAEVDDAELYFQSSHFESWSLEGGIVKEGSHSIQQGAGVRVVAGEKRDLPTVNGWKCPFCCAQRKM